MGINYCRTLQRVKCDSCGIENWDVDVEKMTTEPIYEEDFAGIIMTTTMPCVCGGKYKYIPEDQQESLLEAIHSNCVLIGSGLTSEESGEVVIGSGENNIRFKADGRVIYKGNQIEVDKTLVKNMEYIFRKLLSEISGINT